MKVTTLEDGRELASYAPEDKAQCSFCMALAVVPLTPRQLAEQPDDTSHVCHPALGGCNQGYAVDA